MKHRAGATCALGCVAVLAFMPVESRAQPTFTAAAAPNSPTLPGCSVPSPGGSQSPTPLSAEGLCDLAGANGGTARGYAQAREGFVAATATAAKRLGGNDVPMSASGTAIFIDQVTFTPLPGVPDPGRIQVRMNLAFTSTHGAGAWAASSDIQGLVVLGGVTLRLRSVRYFEEMGTRGSDNFDFLSPAPGLLQTPVISVPVNSPDTLQVSLEVSAGAQREGFASAEATLAFPTGMNVFELPPGFTATATRSFLFNNRFIPESRPPVAFDQTLSTLRDTPLPITLTATDSEPSVLTFAVVSPPAHGTLTGTTADVLYTPSAGYLGDDFFSFRASDGRDDSNTATVTISVVDVLPDAGVADAIGPDAGSPTADASAARDAAQPAPDASDTGDGGDDGCGCATTRRSSRSELIPALLLVAFVVSRRRRGATRV